MHHSLFCYIFVSCLCKSTFSKCQRSKLFYWLFHFTVCSVFLSSFLYVAINTFKQYMCQWIRTKCVGFQFKTDLCMENRFLLFSLRVNWWSNLLLTQVRVTFWKSHFFWINGFVRGNRCGAQNQFDVLFSQFFTFTCAHRTSNPATLSQLGTFQDLTNWNERFEIWKIH